jgi:isopropylmalate/homocitrate/citramalate synthase
MTCQELPDRVLIREVGPRDGFQHESKRISTDDKVRLINALARTGLRRIEVASFVRPDVIPQLDDAIEVLHRIDVPDERGMEIEGHAVARLFAEGHADAGITAFLEKQRVTSA